MTAALGVLAVRVQALPGYTPHLKGSVETLDNAATVMFFAGLPRYTQAPRLANGKPADPDARALTYEAFVAALPDWVCWWNTAHEMDSLGGRTPLATVPAGDLRLFTLEDDGRRRKITTKGVQWRSRCYAGTDWMTGQAGRSGAGCLLLRVIILRSTGRARSDGRVPAAVGAHGGAGGGGLQDDGMGSVCG